MFPLVVLLRRALSKGSAVGRSSLFLAEGLVLRDVGLGRKTPPTGPCARVPAREGEGAWGQLACRVVGPCSAAAVLCSATSLAVARAPLPVTWSFALLAVITALFFHPSPWIGLSGFEEDSDDDGGVTAPKEAVRVLALGGCCRAFGLADEAAEFG